MPRPKNLTPNAHLHITIEARLRNRLDQAVWSDLEGRIPAGGLQRFVEARLREYFHDQRLDLRQWILGADVVSGSPATIAALVKYLEERK